MRGERSRRRRREVLISLSVLAAAATLTSPADGRVQYPDARDLSAAGQLSSSPQVAIDSQGRTRMVWVNFLGEGRIQTVRLSADGTLGPISTISPQGESAGQPQLAVDSQGRATVVWRASGGGVARIRSARIAANGVFGPANSLVVGSVQNPQVAIDSLGRSTVVWRRVVMGEFRVEWVRLGPDQGAPIGPFEFLSQQGGNVQAPHLVIDSQDRATVVWARSPGGSSRVESRRIDANGNLEALILLSAGGQSAEFPHVAVDPQDRTTAVWYRFDGTSQRVQSVRFPGAETSQTLSAAGRDAIIPRVAIDPQGRATVVWLRSDGSNWRVQSRRIRADGTLDAISTLSAAGEDAFSPRVAVDGRGLASAIWSRFDGANERIQAVRLGASGAPGAVQTLSASGLPAESAQVAIDAQNRPIVVWQRAEGGGPIRIQATRGTLVPPDTEITAGPGAGEPTHPSPAFAFAAIPAADVDRFECRIDGGAFAACASPQAIGPLADGPHTFAVRAVDSDGADPTPAERSFVVDSSLPFTLTLSGKRRQRLRKAVKVRASCDVRCALVARGRLVIRKRRGGPRIAVGAKRLRLRPARGRVAPAGSARLKPQIRRRTRALAKRALRRGGRVRARLRVTATDANGNTVRASRAVRLTLRRGNLARSAAVANPRSAANYALPGAW